MNAIKIAYLFDPTTEMTGYARKRAEYFQQQLEKLASSLHPEDLLLELRTLAELREFTS
ncbi:PAS domain-containing protein [Chryseomicrobium excrementi]|uniref:PAS domain-containing protein n=1 Tax=Chryseomicrobium excrementi TaxID=2041346 RepID=UPI0013FDE58D|nr:PAS domain-containing protein [Chryseomicrobium excrementi]